MRLYRPSSRRKGGEGKGLAKKKKYMGGEDGGTGVEPLGSRPLVPMKALWVYG